MKRLLAGLMTILFVLSFIPYSFAEDDTMHIWFALPDIRHEYAAKKTTEQYPDLRIVYHDGSEVDSAGMMMQYSDEYTTRLLSRDPDMDLVVFDMGTSGREKLLSGVFEDIGQYAEITEQANALSDIVNLYKIGDALFGVPQTHSMYLWYGNRELFEKMELPVPTSAWTWDDFFALGKQVYDYNQMNGTDYKLIYEDASAPYAVKQYALNGVDYVNRTHQFNLLRFKELLHMWLELREMGVYQIVFDRSVSSAKYALEDTLITVRRNTFGQSGIIKLNSQGVVDELSAFELIMPPEEDNLLPGIVDLTGIALTSFSDMKEEALCYLSAFLDPQASMDEVVIKGALPSTLYNAGPLHRNDLNLEHLELPKNGYTIQRVNYWINLAGHASVDTRDEITRMALVNGSMGGGFFDLADGIISVDEYIDNCCRIADQYLGE